MAAAAAWLLVWMIIRARRQLRSRTRRWIVYPLLTVLALASIGGGYETVRESIDATAYPRPASSSMWACIGCTRTAPAPAAPQWSWSQAWVRSPRDGVDSAGPRA